MWVLIISGCDPQRTVLNPGERTNAAFMLRVLFEKMLGQADPVEDNIDYIEQGVSWSRAEDLVAILDREKKIGREYDVIIQGGLFNNHRSCGYIDQRLFFQHLFVQMAHKLQSFDDAEMKDLLEAALETKFPPEMIHCSSEDPALLDQSVIQAKQPAFNIFSELKKRWPRAEIYGFDWEEKEPFKKAEEYRMQTIRQNGLSGWILVRGKQVHIYQKSELYLIKDHASKKISTSDLSSIFLHQPF